MKKDWRFPEEQIRRELAEARKPIAIPLPDEAQWERSFLAACLDYLDGNKVKLESYLRSHSLSHEQQADLADCLAGRFERTEKPGPKRQRGVRYAADGADWVYRRWRQILNLRGINGYGIAGQIKYEAARLSLEIWPEPGVTVDQVVEMMGRGKSRKGQLSDGY